MLMASMLAQMPELRRQVQADHAAERGGSCRECGPATRWPCEVYQIAVCAEHIGAGRPTDPRYTLANVS
jgi:hypothetical protein